MNLQEIYTIKRMDYHPKSIIFGGYICKHCDARTSLVIGLKSDSGNYSVCANCIDLFKVNESPILEPYKP